MDNKTKLLNIFQEKSKCTKCSISTHCNTWNQNIVMGKGNINAKLMIIGEAPGEDEDLAGEPFIGMCGKFLDKILDESGIKREDIYISNSVSCRPYEMNKRGTGIKNRLPTKTEIENCFPWLFEEIEIIKPKLIITLGLVSTKLFIKIKTTEKFKDYIGKFHYLTNGIYIIPYYHPAYMMRSPEKWKKKAVKCFKNVWSKCNGLS